MSEIVPIQDTVCSGLGAIERLGGGLYRFWFYVEQTGDDGSLEKIVVTKLVTPACAVPDTILKSIAAMNVSAVIPLARAKADMVN